MQRLTAIFLLLFALAGTFVPVAVAATSAPPHACCIRHAHHCHDSAASASNELALRGAGCCNHDCCRAGTTSQRAHPRACLIAASAQQIAAPHAESPAAVFVSERSASQSPRAPPSISLA